MRWIQTISGKVLILLTLVFAFSTIEKIQTVNSGEKTCVCAHDGFGYYMYLPQLFNHGNLDIQRDWAQNLQNKYCNGAYVYQLEEHIPGKNIDIYHMGLSMVLLPSYTIADLTARATGYPTDGFSYPYMIAYLLNALLFIFLGLLYLRKLLLLYTDDLRASVVLIVIALGTNAYLTFNIQYDLTHLYLFTLNSITTYHLLSYNKTGRERSLWYSAIIFGLTVFIRPTQALLGIIPLIVLFRKFGRSKTFFKKLLLFPGMALLWNLPQIAYWKIVGGDLILLNLHSEDIVLSDPNLLDFLGSYRKGWLLYTPLFLILPIAWWFMYKKERMLFYATLSFSAIYIYVMSSWECWWYAASFGQRVMVDIYPILALVLTFLVNELKRPIAIAASSLFAVACISLNLFQTRQLELGILDPYLMSKEHYWHIFGELDPQNVHRRWLLINRANINWPRELGAYDDNPFEIKTRKVYTMEKPLISNPGENMHLDRINVLKTFITDETQLIVPVKYRTSDSTQDAHLQFECVSDWNCYSWNSYELSLNRPQNTVVTDTFRFNLPDIRHRNDFMQIYIWNSAGAKVELLEFEIYGTSILRK